MKLRTKIQLFASLFILVLMLLINASIYFLFYKSSAENELDEVSERTDEMVKTMNEQTDISRKDLLGAFLPNNGMIQVISESEEQILAVQKPIEHEGLPSGFYNKEMHEIKKNDRGSNVAVVSKPIIWEDGEVVTIQVSKQLLPLEETMTTLLYVLVIASLIMLIPAIIGGRILAKMLLQPIQTLIQTMKRNTEQAKWEKISIRGKSRDELFEMKKTFNDMIDRLKANFRKQETFVSDASHELKTPIAIIKSYAQMLIRRKDAPPELLQESIESIDSEADRMQSLVEQMLTLAGSREQAKKEDVDIISLYEDAVHTFQGVNDREILFDKRLDINKMFVYGNANQLRQIVYILMDNALKYSTGTVKVTLENEDKKVLFRVTDYGPGIPEEEQDNIFDRFYRIDKARSREAGGTGLGLPIAKTLAQSHGGDIIVASQVELGTIFTLRLPIMINKS